MGFSGAQRAKAEGKPLPRAEVSQVGEAMPWELSPDLATAVRGGEGWLWTHTLRIEDASFLKPHFVDLNLRAGDVLRLRSVTGELIEEIRGRGPKDLGTFWGLSAFGDTLRLEFVYRQPYLRAPWTIDRVILGEAGLFEELASGSQRTVCSEPDFEDVECYSGDPQKWAGIQATVGVMTVGGNPQGAIFCSGSSVSGAGHVLTNEHCLGSQLDCDNAEFLFGYHRAGCNIGAPPVATWQSFRCDELLVSSPFVGCDVGAEDLDFSLLSLLGDPASSFGAARLTDERPVSGDALYIVQHPRGRPKEITHGSGGDVVVEGRVLRAFGTLDTEGGSSGSPVFRQSDDKIVALHHCGGCDGPEGNRGIVMAEILPLIEDFLCTEDLELEAVGFNDLREVAGNGNGVIDAGETWSWAPVVRNLSCAVDAPPAAARVVIAAGAMSGITLLEGEVDFPPVPAGEAVASQAPVRFRVEPTGSCGGTLAFDLVQLAAGGIPYPDRPLIFSDRVGELVETTLFSEDFSTGFGPWEVIDGGTGSGPAATWTTDNPAARLLALAEPYALADSDQHGLGLAMDEELISPPVDVSGYSQVELRFAHDFRWYPLGADEKADVDLRSSSTDGQWVNIARFSGQVSQGPEVVDISSWAAGQTDLQIRFHYYDASFEWWWAVDDVFLIGNNGFVCVPFVPTIFADGFESGNFSAWASVSGL